VIQGEIADVGRLARAVYRADAVMHSPRARTLASPLRTRASAFETTWSRG
jgi:hypothetical protein